MARICVIDGHPDPAGGHFCNALADAYTEGAAAGGHEVSRIAIGPLDVELLGNAREFATPPPEAIDTERQKIEAAEHVVLVYPLWLGTMPAKTKAFLEQMARGEFLLATTEDGSGWPSKMMQGKSARLIVTMGMPGAAYKLIFGAHSLKALEQGIFRMSGFKPVRHTVLGMIGAAGDKARARMLDRVRTLGEGGK